MNVFMCSEAGQKFGTMILDTGLFELHTMGNAACYWRLKNRGVDKEMSIFLHTHLLKNNSIRLMWRVQHFSLAMPFEKILEAVSPEVGAELLFHLDLFNQEIYHVDIESRRDIIK